MKTSLQSRLYKLEGRVSQYRRSKYRETYDQADIIGRTFAYEIAARILVFGKKGDPRDAVERFRRSCDGENVPVLSLVTCGTLAEVVERHKERLTDDFRNWWDTIDVSKVPSINSWTYDNSWETQPAQPEYFQRIGDRNRPLLEHFAQIVARQEEAWKAGDPRQ